MDELIRAAEDVMRIAEHVDTRHLNSYERVIRERDLMERRVRQEYEEQWRTAEESTPYRQRRGERFFDFARSDEVSDYAYDQHELPVGGHDIRAPPSSSPYITQRGQMLARPVLHETRDISSPSSGDDSYPSGRRRRNLHTADQTNPACRHRSSHSQSEARHHSYTHSRPPRSDLQPGPQYISPPGYNTALAESQQAIQAFLNDEYDPPPPYNSPERPRRKDKKNMRAKDHQKLLNWLAGRRRLGSR